MQGKKLVRILAMSDTHNLHHLININQLPEADIFIHAGDFTLHSSDQQLKKFYQFLQKLPFMHKIVVAGNHDHRLIAQSSSFQSEIIQKIKQLCIFLEHECIEIQGVNIFGSSREQEYFDFRYDMCPKLGQEQIRLFRKIDILITHRPPLGILDKARGNKLSGSKGIRNFCNLLKPAIHIFGHIHQNFGSIKIDNTSYFNVSVVDENYQVKREGQLIELYLDDINGYI